MRLTSLSFGFLSLLFALPAQGAVSVVQSNSTNVTTSGTAVSASFSSNTSAGNLIAVACLSAAASGTVSGSDNAIPANSYTAVAAYNVKSPLGGAQWFYAKSISGGTDTVTYTFSTSSSSRSIFLYEITGVSTVTPFDVHAESSGSSTTPDTITVNSSSANEIVLGVAICGSTCSSGSGFTGLSDGHGNEAEFKIVTVTGPQHTPFSQASANWADSMVTFTDTGSIAQTNVTNTFTAQQNFDADVAFKGFNPYIDARRYGVRPLASASTPAVAGITATISSGSPNATVSTSVCLGQTGSVCFVNGDGVTVYGAGATNTLVTPSAPAVTPSTARGMVLTGDVVNAPTGATTYNYKIVACDIGGGCTTSSAQGQTITGTASLGSQSVNITSSSRSGVAVTVTTSSAHGLVAGSLIIIAGNSDGTFNGWYQVASTADNTHFVYNTNLSTADGASISSTGGTVTWFNANHITWSAIAGAFQYAIYTDRANPGTFVIIGLSKPTNPQNSIFTDGTLYFDDFGSPFMDNFTAYPGWIPATAPSSATNDSLITTISSGAGTTTLTLAASATNTVSNATIVYDIAPNLSSAATAAQGVPIVLPFSSNTYVLNSNLNLTGTRTALVGPLTLNGMLLFEANSRWQGTVYPVWGTIPSFGFQANFGILCNVSPCFFVPTANTPYISGMHFLGKGNNQLMVLMDGGGGGPHGSFDIVSFSAASGAQNYTTIGLMLRGGNCPRFS